MGSSYTSFRGKGFWARDPGLEVWLHLLAREAEREAAAPAWLHTAARHWGAQASAGFVGCIDAGLDRHASSQERVELIERAAERALAWLRACGPRVSREVLNSFETGAEPAGFTADVPTDVFLAVGEAFVRLLRGQLDTTASTSPVLT